MADRDPDDRRDGDDWGNRDDRGDGNGEEWASGDDDRSEELSSNGGSPDPAGAAPGGTDGRLTIKGLLSTTAVSAAVLLLGVAVGMVGLVASITVLSVGFGMGFDTGQNVTVLIVLQLVLLQGVGFGVASLAYLRYRGLGLEYLRTRSPTWSDVKWVVGIFVASFAILIAGNLFLSALGLGGEGHSIAETASGNPEILLALIPLSFLLIGPGEELLFRGVIQNAFVDRIGVRSGIAASSAFFVLIHLPNYSGLEGLPTLGLLFVISLTWGYAYERTDSLFVPAMAHAAYNATQFGLLYITLKYAPETSSALLSSALLL
ncbi:CPBP family intramembrane glutamic endopeptidase [Natronoarchaeum mannanilyticum]|uniref:CAAX prenyl protease 2/Lysostaphin resistance protein A-like domain-containing protein n=1 Tax=Natronoarchaeum mannanilyticum TaxID=926360 RepID=A0AAV3T701_9EURY